MLSSRMLRHPARQLISRSPKPPSQSPILPTRRAFHASAPRNDVLHAFLYLPHEMMSLIHTQLPWYATIPLSAFLMRALLVTTVGTWSRANTARYIGLHPLRQAIANQKKHELMRSGGFSNPKQAKVVISREIKKATTALDKRWNCSVWWQLNWTFAQLPIFLTMAEVIRQMCGARDGVLSVGLSRFGFKEEAYKIHEVAMGPENVWLQPSLANEGMLWFPDLLHSDPTGTLPFVVSGLMFSNVYFTKNGTDNPNNTPAVASGLRKFLLGVSLLIGPMCQELPAALMLYWASSTSSVMLWNIWLDWKHPAPRDFVACKRPFKSLPPPSASLPKPRRI